MARVNRVLRETVWADRAVLRELHQGAQLSDKTLLLPKGGEVLEVSSISVRRLWDLELLEGHAGLAQLSDLGREVCARMQQEAALWVGRADAEALQ